MFSITLTEALEAVQYAIKTLPEWNANLLDPDVNALHALEYGLLALEKSQDFFTANDAAEKQIQVFLK